MYQQSYAEVLEDDQQLARRVESQALQRVVTMLRHAVEMPSGSLEGVRALHATCELWSIFMVELASSDNALPGLIRANLLSIGLWVLREAEAIRAGRSTNYAGIADVCAMIRDGLL